MSDFKIIEGHFNSFQNFVNAINEKSKKQSTLLVGIDGCGGSGKSTFAYKLKEELSNSTIVHKDDFHLPSSNIINTHPSKKPIGADFDWKRLLNQVLEPIRQERDGRYQRYDWETDKLAEWHTVPAGGIVIIEGVYSIRKELEDKYDFKIWVDCPREIRLSRGLERDGDCARGMWEDNWMISEDIYVEAHKPFKKADLVISGTL
ncbi:uridine kinase [Paenibacillus terrae]|uniref:uridine kinase family protein n=1 Tax=Paenibacillus terrae TaxID=159743 RepID=UPI0005CBD3A3|nr:AAA family ATPase [Paenibacillus terrae]